MDPDVPSSFRASPLHPTSPHKAPQEPPPSIVPSLPTREQLYEEMVSYTLCSLKASAQSTVFSDGNPKSSIMVIGEAPGAEEDRLGKPFVGTSGKLLDAMFAAIGLNRQETLYITNVVPWRPPFNRQPTAEEINLCLPFVEKHIAIIQPKVLVLMGSVACRALLRSTEPMATLQARENIVYTNSYLPGTVPTFVFYHPAYLLRSPGQKKKAWQHLRKLRSYLHSSGVFHKNDL